MLRIATVALALAGLPLPQDKGAKEPIWVEVAPERVKAAEAKRVMKFEDRLVFEVAFLRRSYGKQEGVSAHCFIHNPTKKTLNATLHVAVFDEDQRLISTSSLTWEGTEMLPAIKPGEKREGTSLGIDAPVEALDRIKFAQARLYVWE